MGVPIEGFFYGADVAFATPTPSSAAHKIPAKALTPPTEPVPREKGTHTEGVGETTPLSAETPAPPKRAISPAAIQTKAASSILPLVISTSDPFAAFSQAAKDGSSLIVTPSSIPSSATRSPDTNLSSEGSDDILEDPDDAPILKKRISDSDEEEIAPPEPDFMGMCLLFFSAKFTFFFLLSSYMYLRCSLLPFICMPISPFAETFEGPGVAADVGMPAPAMQVYSYHTFYTCFCRTHCTYFYRTHCTCFCHTHSPHSY